MDFFIYKYLPKKFFKEEKNIEKIFIFILLSFCSFKFFGYSFGFLLIIPFLLIKINYFISYIKQTNIKERLVLIYFLYFSIQSFIGAYKVNDIRIIIYWTTFFIVCAFTYFYNNYLLKNNCLNQRNYIDLIFNSSTIYFIIFFIINFISIIFEKNPWSIQNNFWVGGSTSFNISSLFLYCLFKKWSDISFKINTKYTILISFYTFLVLLNETRLGQLYLMLFIFFIILKSITFKKLINSLLISIICFYTFSIGSFCMSYLKLTNNPYYYPKTIIDELKVRGKFFRDDKYSTGPSRIEELSIGLEKFKESSISEKIFGTGWYSSRVTIGPIRNRIINKLDSNKKEITKNKINHLQGIVSLILDNGIFGFTYSLVLFSILLKNILLFNSLIINKLFYLSLILVNLLCLFIGYPWINIPFILMLVPKGIFLLEEKNK